MKTDYRSMILKFLGVYSRDFHIARKKVFRDNLRKDNENVEEINPFRFLKYYISTILDDDNDKIVLSSTEFVITQKCTLSCEKCANLMPLYENPVTFSSEELKKDFDAYMEVVDYVYEIRLIGGEPFLNDEIDALLKYIFDNYDDKFAFITFTTNGMVKLSDNVLKAIKEHDNRIYLTVSDYGSVSQNIIPQLKENKIKYNISRLDWIDYGPMKSNKYSVKELCKIFSHCSIKIDCNNLYEGRFHLCPRDAHGISLGILDHNMYVDLRSNTPIDEKKKQMKQLNKTKYIPSCDYCKIYEKIPIDRPYFD